MPSGYLLFRLAVVSYSTLQLFSGPMALIRWHLTSCPLGLCHIGVLACWSWQLPFGLSHLVFIHSAPAQQWRRQQNYWWYKPFSSTLPIHSCLPINFTISLCLQLLFCYICAMQCKYLILSERFVLSPLRCEKKNCCTVVHFAQSENEDRENWDYNKDITFRYNFWNHNFMYSGLF